MDYLNFDLGIGTGSGREYPVMVNSPSGQAHQTMLFPFDELALESRLKDVQIALLRSGSQSRQLLSTEVQAVQDFGRALFEALFTGEVRSSYEVSQLAALNQGKGLRVRLHIQSPELAALPWEFLYDKKEREYVCLSSNTPLVRYVELPRPPQPLTITPPLRILGMTASPHDLPELDVVREKQRIEQALQNLQAQGMIEFTWLEKQTADDLQQAMWAGPWHVFHFVGHGNFSVPADEGLIALKDENGNADFLRATYLGRLLADHRTLRLVVLNSCEGARGSIRDFFSSTASILVGRGIPAVLAMQHEITDRAAITLARAFYTALSRGMPIDQAVSEARKTMSIRGGVSIEWGTPVLYMRSPDGVLFRVKPETSPFISHEGSVIPTLAESSPHASPPLVLPSSQEGLSSQGSEQSSISSLGKEQTVPPQVSPKEASVPSSTTPPTKDILTLDSSVEPVPIKGKVEAFTLVRTLTGHTGGVRSLAISPDGQTLVSGGEDRMIRVWHLHTGNQLRDLKVQQGGVVEVAISPNGVGVASVNNNNPNTNLWRLDTMELLHSFKPRHIIKVFTNGTSVAFDPHGKSLISASNNGIIEVWDINTKTLIRSLGRFYWNNAIQSISISPDGQTLVSGSEDQMIRVWHLHTGTLLYTLIGHTGGVRSLAISPDGQTLVSRGADQTIKVWHLHTGTLLYTLEHTGGAWSLAISPDGQTLVSGGADQTIKVWEKK